MAEHQPELAIIRTNWRDLIRPKSLLIDKEGLNRSYGKFTVEPLERGFGTTLGNALRRVLLSSLQGAAVYAIKVEGALHEFTALPDVVEDMTDIILNLKEVRMRMFTNKPVTAYINKTGPGDVTAGDIQVDSKVEILNKEQHIASLSENGSLKAEILMRTGRGYVPSELNKSEELGVGWIPIDSLFSPVRKVNYKITHSRVGQVTDYDKLVLEVVTDGSIIPADAVAYGAKILKEQLTIFINFEEEAEDVEEEKVAAEKDQLNENLWKSVEELELSVRSSNCLQNANIKYIGELVQRTESEMLKTKNFGRKSLKEIKEILSEMGLSLGIKIDWPGTGGKPPEKKKEV